MAAAPPIFEDGRLSRFFFHFVTESERDEDLIGVELPSAEAAYLEAVRAAYSMAEDLFKDGVDASRCGFQIADARGELLMALDFAELLKRDRRAPSCNGRTVQLASAIENTHRRVTVAKDELRFTLEQARFTLVESAELIAQLNRFGRAQTIDTIDRSAA